MNATRDVKRSVQLSYATEESPCFPHVAYYIEIRWVGKCGEVTRGDDGGA